MIMYQIDISNKLTLG